MPPALAYLSRRFAATIPGARLYWAALAFVGLHGTALAILIWSEADFVGRAAFILAWGLLNFLALLVLRRPLAAAAVSLTFVVVLVLLSRFKHGVLLMTVNFLDLWIIDQDTAAFLFKVFPDLGVMVSIAAALILPCMVALWWFDPFRPGFGVTLAGSGVCLAGLTALSLVLPNDLYEEFADNNYVSKFARSGVTAVIDLATRGYLEADETAVGRLAAAADETCKPAARPPHIIMVFDESSFDISALPGVKVPAGYSRHFLSFDGKARKLLVEGAGGPSWYTEYNILTGLSVRSFGRFADFVTRIAAGKVTRGLPRSLRNCGYKTFSLYPMYGWFAGARGFQQTTGIQHFLDLRDLGSTNLEPDRFYYDAAVRLMKRERGDKPLFMLVYTALNHFPWNYRIRPELTPDWKPTDNPLEVDEYLRRQSLSAQDYPAFIERLKREFPGEPILVVRFGDHQPSFAKSLVDPALDDGVIARRIAEADPRFLATYYAIEGINFRPVTVASALDVLDAPYLPLVVLEAAGLPLDPAFAEQKRILQRCRGLFYRCAAGAETRRFNRLLIDAGLINGLASR